MSSSHFDIYGFGEVIVCTDDAIVVEFQCFDEDTGYVKEQKSLHPLEVEASYRRGDQERVHQIVIGSTILWQKVVISADNGSTIIDTFIGVEPAAEEL